MKFGTTLTRLKNFLTSPLPIAGLEVSNTSLKYLQIKNNAIIQASLRLPPGIVERGIIKDKKNLIAALKNLHLQVAPLTKTLNIVLVVPSKLVFAQAFTVPIVEKEHLEESILLNLQMISPNKIEESYYDWQEIKENKDLGSLDLLGAFTASAPINEYEEVLKEANFSVVAVEFPGLSLARLIKERWGGIEQEQQYILIYLSGEGLLVSILKNGNLYFNHFTPWLSIQGSLDPKTTSFDKLQSLITQEIQRVLNYYLGKVGKPLTEAILISPVFNYEIVKIASEKLGLKIRNLTIAELPDLQPAWFPALGAGLRGIISRAKDSFISLTQTSTLTEYYQERLINFTRLWRHIILSTVTFIFISYVVVDSSFVQQEKQLRLRTTEEFSLSDLQNSRTIQENIGSFNRLLGLIEKVTTQENTWSQFIVKMQSLAGVEISIERLYADKVGKTVQISGKAQSEQAAINYKNRLLAVPEIENVLLPLSNLKTDANQRVSFSLTFKVKTFTD